jgi:hypothetical protein
MDTNTQDDYDTTGKGSKDFQGKGVKFAKAVSPDGTAQKNMKSLSPGGSTSNSAESTETPEEQKESVSIDVSDFVEALFEGQNLSEEFKEKATVIFESALNQKVQLIEQAILEASQEVIAEQVADNVAIITEKVDDYLNLVVKEWLTENKLAVEQGFRTEIAENFISGLKELFENSYVEVPEEKVDLVDELFTENRKLEDELNKIIQEKMALEETNLVNECATVFLEVSSDLADTEVEKLASLSEGIEFSDVDTYRNKLSVLKESYIGKSTPSSANTNGQLITEDTSITGETTVGKPGVSDQMSVYINAVKRQLKNTNSKF